MVLKPKMDMSENNCGIKLDTMPNEVLQRILEYVYHEYGWQRLYSLRILSRQWKANIETVLSKSKVLNLNGTIAFNEWDYYPSIENRLKGFLQLSPLCQEINLIDL